MFANWLDLFEAATAADFLSPRLPVGSRALRIAESLKLAAFFRPNHSWRQDLRHRPPVVDTCA